MFTVGLICFRKENSHWLASAVMFLDSLSDFLVGSQETVYYLLSTMLIALSAALTPVSSTVGSGWNGGEQAVIYTGLLLGEAGCLDVTIFQCVDTMYAVRTSHTNHILLHGIKLCFPGSNASRRDEQVIDVGNDLAGNKLLFI